MSTGLSSYPYSKLMGGGVARQNVILERNEFHNFHNETHLGMAQHAITLLETQSDMHPIYYLYDTHFNNITTTAIAWMQTPPDKWANLQDCGEFPCSAPLNTILRFEGTTFEGEN
jgi:hypothetical protein